eukprot:TRINITY_DN32932_c1_g2_i1.p1 TRINITY_DN32932_c1_g2~~TRINITY_DN32932_c1_g2_i1.p1  ORF type:complete len:1667 (+),score=352.40 TRINITY_DN32932_c1_g2_i1:126-5003(+)
MPAPQLHPEHGGAAAGASGQDAQTNASSSDISDPLLAESSDDSSDEGSDGSDSTEGASFLVCDGTKVDNVSIVPLSAQLIAVWRAFAARQRTSPGPCRIGDVTVHQQLTSAATVSFASPGRWAIETCGGSVTTEGTVQWAEPEAGVPLGAPSGGVLLGHDDAYDILRSAGHTVPAAAQHIASLDVAGNATVKFQSHSGLLEAALHASLLCASFTQPPGEVFVPAAVAEVELRPAAVAADAEICLEVSGGRVADSAGLLRIDGLQFRPAPRLRKFNPCVCLRSTADTTVIEPCRSPPRTAEGALLRAMSIAVDNSPDPTRLHVYHALAEAAEVQTVLHTLEPFLPSTYTTSPRPGAADLHLPFAGHRSGNWEPTAAPAGGPAAGFDIVYATDLAEAYPDRLSEALNSLCAAPREGGFVLLHERQDYHPAWICALLMCPARRMLELRYGHESSQGCVYLFRTQLPAPTKPPTKLPPPPRRSKTRRAGANTAPSVSIPAMHTTYAQVGAPLRRAAAQDIAVALNSGGAPEARGLEAAVRSLRRERPGAYRLCATFGGAATGLLASSKRERRDPFVRTACLAEIYPSSDLAATCSVGSDLRLRLSLDQSLCYVLHGALSSVGLQLARWLAARGARHIVFTMSSFRSASAVLQQYHIAALRAAGCEVVVSTRDAADFADCRRLFNELPAAVGGVFILTTAPETGCTSAAGAWDAVVRENVGAAHNLYRLTCTAGCLFVCWNSADAVFGTAGRAGAGWAYSCGVLDGLCEERKKEGYHALCVQFGPVGDEQCAKVGSTGLLVQSARRCFDVLETLLLSELEDAVVCCFATRSLLPDVRKSGDGPITISGCARWGAASAGPPDVMEATTACSYLAEDTFMRTVRSATTSMDSQGCSVFASDAAFDSSGAAAATGAHPMPSSSSADCSATLSAHLSRAGCTRSGSTAAACRQALLALQSGQCESAVVVGDGAVTLAAYYVGVHEAGLLSVAGADSTCGIDTDASRWPCEAVVLQRTTRGEAVAEQVPDTPGEAAIGDDPGEVDVFPPTPREYIGSHTIRDTSSASEGGAVAVPPAVVETPVIVVRAAAEPLPSDRGAEGGTSDERAHAPPPVRVSIRVRDALFREGTSVAVVVDGDRIGVDGSGRTDNRSMVAVDSVLYQRDQAEVYEAVGRPLAAAVLNGQDGLAIACGPSGSGKTHTIFGGSGDSCGLLPRLLEHLFNSGNVRELEIEVLCIFQEKVYDLLREADVRVVRRRRRRRISCPADWARRPGSERELLGARREAMKRAARAHREAAAARGAEITMRTAALKLRRDPARGADVAVGSRRVRASTAAEAVAAILAAADRRPTAATPVNPHSSRAHLLVNLAVQRWDGRKGCRVQIVDMAGGERLQSHVHDARRREGLSINKTLLALKCSVAARRKGWDYVPVRGSVLTRMLVYEGTHVEWVSTVAPGSCYAAQTRVTIQEAEAVRGLQRTRVEAAALAALKAAQERALAERRERQSVAAGAAAAAGLVAAAAGLLELQEAAERRAAAERVAPAVGAAGAMICTAAYHALWAQTVQRVKKAQAAGGERWTQQYRAALPKACRKVLNPANIRSPCCWRCWPRCRRRTASTRRHRAGHPGATRRRRAGSG